MTPRVTAIGIGVLLLALTGACSSSPRSASHVVRVTGSPSTSTPATGSAPILLAQFDDGVGAVAAGATAPLWRASGAVAALDGSAVFAIHPGDATTGDRLVRLEPATGAVTASWPIAAGRSVSAVAPAGHWVALTDRAPGYGDQGRSETVITVFDAAAGHEVTRLKYPGDVLPEAFSVGGTLMFVLDYRGDHYRVQTIEVRTGDRYDISDRDKQPPEDMHGVAVRGVMSADRTLLATLYRNPGDTKEPSFVHVLDLEHGWSYCADLPQPFGTGTIGPGTIALTPADTVVVSAPDAHRLAEIHIEKVHSPPSTVQVDFRAGTLTPPDAAFRSLPGFENLIGAPGTATA